MKRSLVLCLLLLTAAVVYAGDIATFVDLGFSNDSRYFMFGQYGAQEATSKLYADLYLVNVRTNAFVANGVKHQDYQETLQPGQGAVGALISIVVDTLPLSRQYGINYRKPGRLLYILMDGQAPQPHLQFRDFPTGRSYTIDLQQSQYGSGNSVSSSFYITMKVTTGSTSHTYTVGLPDYRRSGVRNYRIRRIIASPDDKSVVFVVEKEEVDKNGVNVRYMVETAQLN